MRIFDFVRSIVNAAETALNNANNSYGGVASGQDSYDAVTAIDEALSDPQFTFRSLNALQKAAGGLSRDEVREIVFSLGGRQSSDGQELYTLN